MKKADREAAYELVSKLASLDEAQGLSKERSVLLLWFLRNVYGLDEFDAFDYICDGNDDGGIDALYLEEAQGDEDVETLVVFQSYFPETAKNTGPGKLDRLITAVNHLKTEAALTAFLDGDVEPALRRLIDEFDLVEKVSSGAMSDGRLRLRLVFVTTGVLMKNAHASVIALNESEHAGYMTAYDLPRLAGIAEVVAAPESEVDQIEIKCKKTEVLVEPEDSSGNRVAILAVPGQAVAGWEGIEEREALRAECSW